MIKVKLELTGESKRFHTYEPATGEAAVGKLYIAKKEFAEGSNPPRELVVTTPDNVKE